MKKYVFFLILIISAVGTRAQLPLPFPFPRQQEVKKSDGTDRLDSLLALLKNKKMSKIRPYSSVVTSDAVTHAGLFTIYEVRDSLFMEIPRSLMYDRLLMIKRLSKGSFVKNTGVIEKKFYPGEEIESKMVYFAMGPDSVINLYNDLADVEANPGSRIATAVKNANADAVLQTFPIIATTKDLQGYLVDITGVLKMTGPLTSVDASAEKAFHTEYIRTYPMNVELGVYRAHGTAAVPIVVNTSFIGLPKEPLQQRIADRRVGYLTDKVDYFSDEQHKVENREFILRWRLEPKPGDMERWKRGELVEPVKPIVIYIDPNTPKQWVQYLIMGVNDWQRAFEQAGFKNAIVGKEWPKGDSVNLDDARYSFICYLPDAKTNAYGPNIHDLRSGEIIQTHIGWYHNMTSLLHDWYMIQAGATDPRARKPTFDQELMGQLIRFVCSHEVGHSLGLRHNFGASSQTPVEKLRDKQWLKHNSYTSSIMDYARFNYIAQPEDNISPEGLLPHIGDCDKWAIEWGYKYSGAATAEEDKKITAKWATERLTANPRLWFGSMENEKTMQPGWTTDPRAQAEDLGDNSMVASSYGIKNLKRILPSLPAWCHEPNGQYGNLEAAFKQLQQQYKQYIVHVLTNVGGIERTYKTEEMNGDVYAPVPKEKQLQALAFFNKEVFTTPGWLLDPVINNKIISPTDPDFVCDLQVRLLNTLMDTSRFNALASLTSRFGEDRTLSQSQYLDTLHFYIWHSLTSGKPMDVYQRNLQKTYLGNLSDILLSMYPGITETETYSLAYADMLRLQKELNEALEKYTNSIDRSHIESQITIVDKVLKTGGKMAAMP